MIPHILRLCGLSDHRVLLPAVCRGKRLAGADIIARLALRRRAADWRGDGDPRRAGLYLVAAAFAGAGIARRRRQGRRRFRLTSLDRVAFVDFLRFFRDFAGLEGGFNS